MATEIMYVKGCSQTQTLRHLEIVTQSSRASSPTSVVRPGI